MAENCISVGLSQQICENTRALSSPVLTNEGLISRSIKTKQLLTSVSSKIDPDISAWLLLPLSPTKMGRLSPRRANKVLIDARMWAKPDAWNLAWMLDRFEHLSHWSVRLVHGICNTRQSCPLLPLAEKPIQWIITSALTARWNDLAKCQESSIKDDHACLRLPKECRSFELAWRICLSSHLALFLLLVFFASSRDPHTHSNPESQSGKNLDAQNRLNPMLLPSNYREGLQRIWRQSLQSKAWVEPPPSQVI